jgi:hypothetical protein
MEKSQVLIDLDVLNLFIKGDDNDRNTIKKLYPSLNFESLRDELLFSLMVDAMKNPGRIYPVTFRGNHGTIKVTVLSI